MIQTLEWTDKGVRFIDQTKLPTEETYVTCKTYEQVADAISSMVERPRLAYRQPWASLWA
jgi:methylthioribose-1-phosphate isomerase